MQKQLVVIDAFEVGGVTGTDERRGWIVAERAPIAVDDVMPAIHARVQEYVGVVRRCRLVVVVFNVNARCLECVWLILVD